MIIPITNKNLCRKNKIEKKQAQGLCETLYAISLASENMCIGNLGTTFRMFQARNKCDPKIIIWYF